MAKSLIFKMLKKGAKIKKTWKNVFALRQEYNKYQQAWFPVIFYWNRIEETTPDGTTRFRCWVECLCTETGSSPTEFGLSSKPQLCLGVVSR